MINLKIITENIEKQRRVVLSKLGRLRREDPFVTEDRALIVEPGTDATMLVGHERTVILEDRLRSDLKEIESALSKIKKGTYGVCDRCGKSIDIKRLEVKPQALYCLKCESEIEKKK
jgi:RNA polymerase-binding transcription factor DksA